MLGRIGVSGGALVFDRGFPSFALEGLLQLVHESGVKVDLLLLLRRGARERARGPRGSRSAARGRRRRRHHGGHAAMRRSVGGAHRGAALRLALRGLPGARLRLLGDAPRPTAALRLVYVPVVLDDRYHESHGYLCGTNRTLLAVVRKRAGSVVRAVA